MSTPDIPATSSQNWWQTLRLRDVALGTLLVMLIVLGFALLLAIQYVLVATFFGILLATALRPVMIWLRNRNVSAPVAAATPVLLLITFVILFVGLTIPAATRQAATLIEIFPGFYDELRTTLMQSPYRIVRQFAFSLEPTLFSGIELHAETLMNYVLASLPTVGYWIFGTVSTLLFTYYWLRYRERTVNSLLLLLPMEHRTRSENVWLQIEDKIGAFLRGQVLLALIVASLSLVGYWLVGMPYALLLALIAGVLELIPYIGPILTSAIATSIGLSISFTLGIYALVVGITVQAFESVVLVPRIMDKAVGVSPVLTLLSLVGFAALFGLGGALLAIPLAAVAQILFGHWIEHTMQRETEETVQGRDLSARLRYQAQNLSQDLRQHLRHKDNETNAVADDTEEELENILHSLDTILKQVEQEKL